MKYALYTGCTAKESTPELLKSTLAVAKVLGVEIEILDEASCCGASHLQDFDDLLSLVLNARNICYAEKLGLDIVDAKILTTKENKAYNTISVLQDDILDQINISQEVEGGLSQKILSVKEAGDKLAHRHFDHKMKISFSHNEKWNLTQVEINVIDKQGLLSNIAYIFHQLDINLVNARITTLGERVEDIFFISNAKKQPLSVMEEELLKQALEEKL